MTIIIAGSRPPQTKHFEAHKKWHIKHAFYLLDAITDSGFEISRVVSGGANGWDWLGEAWAKKNGIPVTIVPADWNQFGKSAGYKRNVEMSLIADAAIIGIVNQSKGSGHMKDIMQKASKPCYVKEISE